LCDKKKNNNIICVDVNDANPILHSISTTQQPEQEKVKEEEEEEEEKKLKYYDIE